MSCSNNGDGLGLSFGERKNLGRAAAEAGGAAPIITSAGALVAGLSGIGARKEAILAPYMKPLTQTVIDYVEAEGFQVTSSHSLEISDNLAVGRRDPLLALDASERLDLSNADTLILSACVQMPSASAIDAAEQKFGLPVVTAASCTVKQMLIALGLEPIVPGYGSALSQYVRA